MVAAALFAIAGAIYWQRAVDQRIGKQDMITGGLCWCVLSIVAVCLLVYEIFS